MTLLLLLTVGAPVELLGIGGGVMLALVMCCTGTCLRRECGGQVPLAGAKEFL